VGPVLYSARLELRPITLAIVEAVMTGKRENVEELAGARVPEAWPGRALVERAFCASLEAIRADPHTRLWGDRLMIARPPGEEPRVVGSVVFHGRPGPDGVCEIGYGVEEQSQRLGFATEAVATSVAWALAQPETKLIQATTFGWHQASIRVLEKVGFARAGTRDHETLGELLVYERAT